MEVRVCQKWLREAWFKSTSFKVKPQLWVSGNKLKITTFKKGGIGMRSVLTYTADLNEECCIEIPDTLRAYLSQMDTEDEITLKLAKSNVMSVILEACSYGVQYQIPNIIRTEDMSVDTSPKDCRIQVCTKSWSNLCRMMPSKGEITLACKMDKKIVTFKHSKGRWAAAITAKTKASKDASFVCDSGVTKFCFTEAAKAPTFSTLIFMDCGVLKWESGNTSVHLAPFVE